MQRRDFLKTSALAVPGAVAAPAIVRAEETFQWKMVTSWPPGFPSFQAGPGSAEDLAKRLGEASGGRLQVKVFAAGELAPWNEVFNACSSGTVEMGHSTPYYWMGQVPASAYFCTVPFGLNYRGYNAWIYHGGGQDLWDEVYGEYGLKAFPCGNTGVQMTGWFREPLAGIESLNGLKMRVSGLAGVIYKEAGVTQVALPASEIFPGLERGVIDAAEWVGPYQDRRMGFHKVAKHYYTTGWHETAAAYELMINRAAWEKLPADLQAIVRNVAQACNMEGPSWMEAVNADALKDLVENEGVKAQPLPSSILDHLKKIGPDLLAANAEKDPTAKKVHDHYFAFKAKWGEWAALTEGVYHNEIR